MDRADGQRKSGEERSAPPPSKIFATSRCLIHLIELVAGMEPPSSRVLVAVECHSLIRLYASAVRSLRSLRSSSATIQRDGQSAFSCLTIS